MNSVARDIVTLLEQAAQILPAPPIAALHLPPPGADGTRDGEFCAIELEDGSLGMSFVLLGDTLARLRDGSNPHASAGASTMELVRLYAGAAGAARALGFAAVNAYTRHVFDRAGFAPRTAGGSLGDLDLGPGDQLGMIGLFPPLVRQVLASGARLTVLELRAELAGARDGWHVTLDAAELAHCNKILSTSTVMLNDTLDAILDRCRHAQRIALVGPGAGCLPDPLFARGVTLLGGSWITDAPGFTSALRQGRPWGGCARKFALAAHDYPGIGRLLEAAGGPVHKAAP